MAMLSFQTPGAEDGEIEKQSVWRGRTGHQLASLSIIETAFSGNGLGRMPNVVGMIGT